VNVPHGFVLSSAGLFGLIMGSAVTALAYRIPRGISWARDRSRCPSCGHVLGISDLVPVLSWLTSLGRCRHCGAPVSYRYPLTEVLCGTWAVLLADRVGLGWDLPLLALWGFLLIALLWIDLDFQLLPDALTFPGTLIGLAAALLQPGGARRALFGLVIGAGTLWAIGWLWRRLRGIEAMGGGDVKLAAMFGVVLGGPLTVLTLFLAALAGSLWGGALMLARRGHMQTALPFGTLLAPAALVAFLWGGPLVDAYLSLLRPH
jgi:leader peptidase (prepilin peptidase)/N-methyltransferase